MAENIVSDDRLARHGVRWRVETHRFLDNHARVAKPGEILIAWGASPEHYSQFVMMTGTIWNIFPSARGFRGSALVNVG
jgi:hypothetical protein